MEDTKKRSRMSRRSEIIILSAILAGLIVLISLTDFMNFLVGLRTGDPISLSVMVSIIGLSFALLHRPGLAFDYKEEIELPEGEKHGIQN